MSSVDGDNAYSNPIGHIGSDDLNPSKINAAAEYMMNKPKRGRFVIINNRYFDVNTGMSERNGTEVDGEKLYQTFHSLGFDVDLHNNIKAENMVEIMRMEAEMNHNENDCFAAAFLSHGDNEVIYGTDRDIKLEYLIDPIKHCQSLVGKPKLFFIQACRGDKLDHGREMFLSDAGDQLMSVCIPLEADFLYSYSTVPGYFSWRNTTKGSWFVQELCNIFDEYRNQRINILTLLTRVNYRVAYEHESSAKKPHMNRKKQIPSIVSMLTKDLYLKPK